LYGRLRYVKRISDLVDSIEDDFEIKRLDADTVRCGYSRAVARCVLRVVLVRVARCIGAVHLLIERTMTGPRGPALAVQGCAAAVVAVD
jgi:hypothetical protein